MKSAKKSKQRKIEDPFDFNSAIQGVKFAQAEAS